MELQAYLQVLGLTQHLLLRVTSSLISYESLKSHHNMCMSVEINTKYTLGAKLPGVL